MEGLKKNSIRINGEIVVCWPQYGHRQETLDLTYVGLDYNGCYAVNNSTICFVTNNEVYVTPYTREAIKTLSDAGLVKKEFFVPFSKWDYPRDYVKKWKRLCELARRKVVQE